MEKIFKNNLICAEAAKVHWYSSGGHQNIWSSHVSKLVGLCSPTALMGWLFQWLGFPCKGISTPHLKTALFIKSWSMIVQMLLLSCTHCPFSSGHFNPIKSFFLLWIWRMTITRQDTHLSRYSFESGTLNPNPGPLPYPKVSFMVIPIGYQRKTKSYSSAMVHYYTQLYFLPGNRYLFAGASRHHLMAAHSWNGCICTCLLLKNKCKDIKRDEKVCELHIKSHTWPKKKRKSVVPNTNYTISQFLSSWLGMCAQVVSKRCYLSYLQAYSGQHLQNTRCNRVFQVFCSNTHNNLSSLLALRTHTPLKIGLLLTRGVAFLLRQLKWLCLSGLEKIPLLPMRSRCEVFIMHQSFDWWKEIVDGTSS